MQKWTITLMDLGDAKIEYPIERDTLQEAIRFGLERVREALEAPCYPQGQPLFMNVIEEALEPSFYLSRWGTPEDEEPYLYMLTYKPQSSNPELGLPLYWTRCAAWVEDAGLARLYTFKDQAQMDIDAANVAGLGWQNVSVVEVK